METLPCQCWVEKQSTSQKHIQPTAAKTNLISLLITHWLYCWTTGHLPRIIHGKRRWATVSNCTVHLQARSNKVGVFDKTHTYTQMSEAVYEAASQNPPCSLHHYIHYHCFAQGKRDIKTHLSFSLSASSAPIFRVINGARDYADV